MMKSIIKQRSKSLMKCKNCGNNVTHYVALLNTDLLCQNCSQQEIRKLVEKLQSEDLNKLRRRIEDRIRKSPQDLISVICTLAISGSIRMNDIVKYQTTKMGWSPGELPEVLSEKLEMLN